MDTSEGNTVVILNPAANRGNMEMIRAMIRSRLDREPDKYEYVETGRPGEAEERARQAASEGRAVIIAGGDGSIHEVVNGLLAAGRRVPLGIIPAGSGNDYAWYALKLPQDPAAAIERAFDGQAVASDAGSINGRYFVNAFSVGLDADIAVTVGKMKKYPFMSGQRLYMASVLRQAIFGYHRCPWLTLLLDDGAQDCGGEKRYVIMAVSIGPSYGAGFQINPTADHTDGLFDICTFDYVSLRRFMQLMPLVKQGKHVGAPEATFYRAKTLRIECRVTANVQMDGETMQAKSISAEVLPSALEVRV